MPKIALVLGLLLVTLTLAEACYMRHGYVCVPRQASCRGRCVVQGPGRCQCQPYYFNTRGRPAQTRRPQNSNAEPGEINLDAHLEMMSGFARLHNMMN